MKGTLRRGRHEKPAAANAPPIPAANKMAKRTTVVDDCTRVKRAAPAWPFARLKPRRAHGRCMRPEPPHDVATATATASGPTIRVLPPLVILAALLVAAVLHLTAFEPRWSNPGVGVFLMLSGLALGAWGIRTQARAGTHPDVRRDATALVTAGPYRYTRNPMYVGLLLLQAGVGVALGWWLALILVPGVAMLLARFVIAREEAQLRAAFPAYAAYAKSVRRWF